MRGPHRRGGDGETPTVNLSITVDSANRVPISVQIARQISWQVAIGRVEIGDHLPTIAELAGQLGVNVHTVRAAYRQLAEDGIVSMRRGSRTRVLGYDRDRALAGNDSHSSFTIGVMVSAFTDYYAEYLEALTRAAEHEGWLPIICQTQHYDARVVNRYLDQLFSRNVDGIILIHFEAAADEEVARTIESSARLRPFVFADSTDVGVGSQILVDRTADAFEATAHLIGHGHKRVGHLGAPRNWNSNVPFTAGYRKALAAAGIPFDEKLIVPVSGFSRDAGAKAAAGILQQEDPPTALFCAGDTLALGAIAVIHEQGLRVPRDVAVMGYGEIPFAALAAPPLSTIRLPADRLAYEAIRVLRRAIDDGEPQPPVTIDTAIVPRESCGCGTP